MERKEAKRLGLPRYSNGKPCKHGHIAERRTRDGRCTECKMPSAGKQREYNARWKARYPGREQEVKYRHRYGVELNEIRAKPFVCDICGNPHKKIVLDHCHKTGEFRGWLCDPCNIALGNVGDNVAILERMISYLEGKDDKALQRLRTASNGLETGAIGQPPRQTD